MTHNRTVGGTTDRQPPASAISAAWLVELVAKQVGRAITEPPMRNASLHHPSRLTRALVVKATVTAAAGLGLLAGGGSAAWAGLQHQAKMAAQRIGIPEVAPPLRDGFYLPDSSYRVRVNIPAATDSRTLSAPPITLAMLGDSTMAGYGAATADDLPGVMLARGVSAQTHRRVHLRTRAVVGSGAAGLALQVRATLVDRPDIAVISVGANDVRDRVAAAVSVAQLSAAVTELTTAGISVVVGTCPDLGVIAPIPPPLRQLAGYWSRTLAAKQEQAMAHLGVACIPLGRIVSPEFLHHPDLFSPDKFHPSGAGYARAVAALLPAVAAAISGRNQQNRNDDRPVAQNPVLISPYLSAVPAADNPNDPAMPATN